MRRETHKGGIGGSDHWHHSGNNVEFKRCLFDVKLKPVGFTSPVGVQRVPCPMQSLLHTSPVRRSSTVWQLETKFLWDHRFFRQGWQFLVWLAWCAMWLEQLNSSKHMTSWSVAGSQQTPSTFLLRDGVDSPLSKVGLSIDPFLFSRLCGWPLMIPCSIEELE